MTMIQRVVIDVDMAGADSITFGDASSVVDPLVGGGNVGLRESTGALTTGSFLTWTTFAPIMGIGATLAAV